jgi:hypothetical protein
VAFLTGQFADFLFLFFYREGNKRTKLVLPLNVLGFDKVQRLM